MKAFQFIKNIFIKNSSGSVINPATEEKQDQNIALLEEIRLLNVSIKELAREQARFSSLRPSELPYAKDISDQMRVTVGAGSINVNSLLFGNANALTTMFTTGSPNAYEAREMLKIQAGIIAELRISRWITS